MDSVRRWSCTAAKLHIVKTVMSLQTLPSNVPCTTNTMVQTENSVSERIGELTLSSEEQSLNAEEEPTCGNDVIQEPGHVNNTRESHSENVTQGSQDGKQNDQNQEQRCIQKSHSLQSSEASNADIQDVSQANCENQSKKEEVFLEDISNFLESVYDLLECPVCLNHMVPPILLCESGHNICFKCRPFMTKCPLCRRSFLQTRNIALEVVARKLGLKCVHEDCHKGCTGLKEQEQRTNDQVTYTCPLTLYTHCYWQGHYSDIKTHIEEIHAGKILTETVNPTWEMTLVVRDFKVIFALGEIFFYKERLDTSNSKFYIQVFYIGQQENHNEFVYHIEISSESGQQKFAIYNKTLPINDLEHTYTYSASHCTVFDYQTIRAMSKHGDLKCTLSLERRSSE